MFVGRDVLIAEILQVDEHQAHREYHLCGLLGTGKTSILRHLDENARVFRCILVNLEDFNPGHNGERGDRASVGAVQGSFVQFKALLAYLTAQKGGAHILKAFESEVTEAFNSKVANRRAFSLDEAIDGTRRGVLKPKDLADAWRDSARAIAGEFLAHWNRDESLRFLLLDNADDVSDQEIGLWLEELLPKLNHTVVVVTWRSERAIPGRHSGSAHANTHTLKVTHFSDGEVRAYLDRSSPGHFADPEVGMVAEISHGHPAMVAVLHDLLWNSGAKDSIDRAKLSSGLMDHPESERTAVLIERLVEARGDAALAEALPAAAVPRSLDRKVLKTLLASKPLSNDDRKRVFEQLSRFSFTEAITVDSSRIRIHPFVRSSMLDRIDEDELHELHQRAAEYHDKILVGKSKDLPAGSYGAAFVYEDPVWQRSKREWLYHRGNAYGDSERVDALLGFARVFLEAFWWWGNYVHFDFCDQLVADLGQIAARRNPGSDEPARTARTGEEAGTVWAGVSLLHKALQCILQEYPPRSWIPTAASWDEVRDALLAIKKVCKLEGSRTAMKQDKRRVAALVDVFLAHSYRYQDPRKPEADVYYQHAATGFKKVHEVWSEGWVYYERAELRFERDELIQAPDSAGPSISALWFDAAGIAQPLGHLSRKVDDTALFAEAQEGEGNVDDEHDEELASNLHRLRGDCCWAGGDLLRAATWYGRAVLHAYLFHFVGNPPDEYTLQLYVDVRARVLTRLLEAWRSENCDEALEVAERMARVLSDRFGEPGPPGPAELRRIIGEERPLPLAHALFPRGPEVAELGTDESEFATGFRRRKEATYRRGGDIDTDLHDEQWP